MNTCLRRAGFAALLLAGPAAATAAAQANPGGGARPDITFAVSAARLDLGGGRYQRYSAGVPPEATVVLQAAAGFSWRSVFRTEVEFACTCNTRRDIFDEEIIDAPLSSTRVFLEHHYQLFRPSASLLYEFRPKRRLRPYAGLAVALDLQRNVDRRVESRESRLTDADRAALRLGGFDVTTIDILPSSFPDSSIASTPHVFARVGFRGQLSERFFVSIEAQGGTRVGALRIGFGLNAR